MKSLFAPKGITKTSKTLFIGIIAVFTITSTKIQSAQALEVLPFMPVLSIATRATYDYFRTFEFHLPTAGESVIPKVEEPEYRVVRTMRGFVTQYSRADSCHYPKWVDGRRLCLTAIGQDTQEGITVACPYSLRLGQKIRIDGHVYTCHDRYAKWLDEKRGLPTFDIFVENNPTGLHVSTIEIVQRTEPETIS